MGASPSSWRHWSAEHCSAGPVRGYRGLRERVFTALATRQPERNAAEIKRCAGLSGHEHKYDDVRGKGFFGQTRRERRTTMRICVILNPAARGGKARRSRQFLDQLGAGITLKLSGAPGAARGLAAEALREGYDLVVAAGGDGTLNEVVNGFGDVRDGFARARLGVLPLGTVNVFAKELNLPTQLPRAWELIQGGRERSIDLPCVECACQSQPQRRYFVQMAGAGFDAKTAQAVDWELKKKIGAWAYAVAGARTLGQKSAPIQVTTDQGKYSGELVLIGNGRFYGGRWPIFSKASLGDGLLDICVFRKLHWNNLARLVWEAWRGQLHRCPEVHYLQTGKLDLTSVDVTPVQVDGETTGELPAKFALEPGKLRIIAP